MKKVSVSVTNDICPQTLFVYGSMNEDGTPDFGLFCWFSYCWFEVPILCSSPISFELEVDKEIAMGEHDEIVLVCRIRNTKMRN